MKNRFNEFKNRFIKSIIIVVLLILIGFTNTGRESVNILERIGGNIITPIVTVTTKTSNVITDTLVNIVNIPSALKENKELKDEVIKLRDENLKLSDVVARSDYLKNEYQIMQNSSFEVVKASVVGKAKDDQDKYLISKGSLSGIEVLDTVIVGIHSSENTAVEGLVGRVDKVGDNWSKISLIDQEDIGISFTNSRTQEGGVIDSFSDGTLKGYTFDNNSDIVAEDRLYTSGLGELYVPGIYIGRVTNVINDEENMRKNIDVSIGVDLDKLNTVLVIVGEKYEE